MRGIRAPFRPVHAGLVVLIAVAAAAVLLPGRRVRECLVCLACIDSCPEGALRFGFAPSRPEQPGRPDVGRRALVGGALLGAVSAPLLRVSGGGRGDAHPRLIHPPGAVAEEAFLDRCVKCALCGTACPTGAIQPAPDVAVIEGFWTPVVVPRRGGCEFACTRCGEVCPTGAIRPLAAVRKTNGGPPVRIGTAFVDRGRCLPWASQIPCIVCEEMCPTDPKAVVLARAEERRPDGTPVVLAQPRVHPLRCVGCGICENRCPVGEEAAIRVSSVGETRDPLRMVLGA